MSNEKCFNQYSPEMVRKNSKREKTIEVRKTAPKNGRMKRKTMQETYGILDGFTCGQFNCGCRA